MKNLKFDLHGVSAKFLLHFDKQTQKFKTLKLHSDKVEHFLRFKRVLVLFPYPSKERLNSELYDDIMKKTKLAQELDKTGQEQVMMNTEVEKLKRLNKFDEILGFSQLDVDKSLEFLKANKVCNISILVDPECEINKKNRLEGRYEMVLNDLKVEEFKKDPTHGETAIMGFTGVYLYVFLALVNLLGYFYIYRSYRIWDRDDKMFKKYLL